MSSNLSPEGQLLIVATPLGNPGDLSPRARESLSQAEAVLAEDTRRAALAFSRWGLPSPRLISLHDHNEAAKLDEIIARLQAGAKLALISDAGMPILADPGYLLVRACRAASIPVSVIPGPCAPVTALAGSGIAPQPFVFFGFLPRKNSDQEACLAPYAQLPVTLVFFERKDRLAHTLELAARLLGPREVCLARELTKTHEEYRHFRLEALPDLDNILGELTVIIGPPEQLCRSSREEVEALIAEESPRGGPPRQIARRVQSRVSGWTSREIYALISHN